MATDANLVAIAPSALHVATIANIVNPGGLSPPGSVDGTVRSAGDNESFPVSLTANQHYIFDAHGVGLSDPTLALHNGTDGATLVFDDDTGPGLDSRIEYTPTTSGTYYLDVQGYSTHTGTFSLSGRIDDVPDDIYTTHNVASNGWVWGTINPPSEHGSPADHDYYGISLTQGQHYTFDVYGENGLGDPTLGLHAASGAVVAYNDDFGGTFDSHIDYTAQQSGTFYLDVGAFGTHTGSYLLVA